MEEMGGGVLRALLMRFDEEASLMLDEHDRSYGAVIVGGAALMLQGLTDRPVTHDIDFIGISVELLPIMKEYRAMNLHAATFADNLPYNYEDRLVELDLHTRAVRFLSPSLEDLAVMKLCSFRPNDQSDLESAALLRHLDWGRLDYLVRDPGEAAASIMSERQYQELLYQYREYRKEHYGKENV